jgi:hypothetical protein
MYRPCFPSLIEEISECAACASSSGLCKLDADMPCPERALRGSLQA